MKIEEIGCALFHDFGANGIAVMSGIIYSLAPRLEVADAMI
jgi:hypothetical protein